MDIVCLISVMVLAALGIYTVAASLTGRETASRYIARASKDVPALAALWGVYLGTTLPYAPIGVWAVAGGLTAHWFLPRYVDEPPINQFVSVALLVGAAGLVVFGIPKPESFIITQLYGVLVALFFAALSLVLWPRPKLSR